MDWHGVITLQKRAREVKHRRNALSGMQRKERDIYLSWTLNCPVAVCQGKHRAEHRYKGIEARVQGTVSSVVSSGYEWHGDRRWYWWLSDSQILKGPICLTQEGAGPLSRMGRVLSGRMSSCWGRNHGGSGAEREIWESDCVGGYEISFSKYLLDPQLC